MYTHIHIRCAVLVWCLESFLSLDLFAEMSNSSSKTGNYIINAIRAHLIIVINFTVTLSDVNALQDEVKQLMEFRNSRSSEK